MASCAHSPICVSTLRFFRSDLTRILWHTVRKNLLNAMQDIRPSHMLDQGLREAAGLHPVTGSVVDSRARAMKGYKDDAVVDWGDVL